MCYCPTPTLHLNLALTGDGAFLFSLKKTHSVWFISVLNYGDTDKSPHKSPSPCNTYVIIQICVLINHINMPPHTHTHTWSSGHTHTHTHTHLEQWTHTHTHTHSSGHTHTHTHLEQWTHTHTHTHTGATHTHTHLEQWAVNAAASGEQLGVRCLAQGSHLSRGQFLPEPRTHNFRLQVQRSIH